MIRQEYEIIPNPTYYTLVIFVVYYDKFLNMQKL